MLIDYKSKFLMEVCSLNSQQKFSIPGFSIKELVSPGQCNAYMVENSKGEIFFAKNIPKKLQLDTEIQCQKDIHSEYVLSLIDIIEREDSHVLLMKYIRHYDTIFLRKEDIEIHQIINILRMIAIGLADIHKEGIIHGDIKLENILVEKGTLKPKIADFGFSHRKEHPMCIYTNSYAAPELITGECESTNEKTDIFALGLTFYAILAGLISVDMIKRNHLFCEKSWNDVNDGVKALITSMLDTQEKRPTASQCAEALNKLL